MVKVKELNIERGFPTKDVAIKNLVNGISTAKGSGFKAVIVVHGYGSSGAGGVIKPAVRNKLKEPSLRGIVKDYVSGEEWYNKKKDFLNYCNQLKDFNKYVDGNQGVTIVLLK
ncbi:MAG: Smr/MutS family protein [Anaerovoracaceae bacterium]